MSTVAGLFLLAGCQTTRPMQTVEYVDVDRFMGDWYVIAHIPSWLEDDAYNAVESYQRIDTTTIQTHYSHNEGGFDGERVVMTPTGYILDTATNATWGMQFIWPIKAEYLIIYLDEDYSTTVIGRSKRDYVWIMAREPEIPAAEYERLVRFVRDRGYDVSRLRKIPQRWPAEPAATTRGGS